MTLGTLPFHYLPPRYLTCRRYSSLIPSAACSVQRRAVQLTHFTSLCRRLSVCLSVCGSDALWLWLRPDGTTTFILLPYLTFPT